MLPDETLGREHAAVGAGVAGQQPEPTWRSVTDAPDPGLPVRVLAAHHENIKGTYPWGQAPCDERVIVRGAARVALNFDRRVAQVRVVDPLHPLSGEQLAV